MNIEFTQYTTETWWRGERVAASQESVELLRIWLNKAPVNTRMTLGPNKYFVMGGVYLHNVFKMLWARPRPRPRPRAKVRPPRRALT